MQKKDLQLTLNICDNLSEQFPQNELYDHVSLTLTGKLYDNDFRFLSGYDDYYESDGEITGGITYFQVGVRWNTIDLDLSGIDPERCYISKLNEIKGLNSIILPIGYQTTDINFSWKEDTMQSLVVSEGTTKIDKGSFIRWISLKDVRLPKSLEKIAPDAFIGCSSLQTFDVPEDSEHFVVCDGVLFSKDRSVLIAFPPGLDRESYQIPEGTTLIAECAFKQNPYIKEVYIPKTVVHIKDYAFENCASLEKIEVDSANPVYLSHQEILYEKGVTVSIQYAGMYFSERRAKLLCVPAANKLTYYESKQTLVTAKCFSGCKNIKSIYLSGKYQYPLRIDGVFDNCWNVEEISLHNVGGLPRFNDCHALRKLEITGNFIGNLEDVINSCKNLKEVNVWNNNYHTEDGVVYKGKKIVFPDCKKDGKKRLAPKNTNVPYVSNKKGRKKKYVVNGKIIGTYEEKTIPINISLYDDELDHIKDIIKSGHYKDLREAIKNDFPEICEKINSKLIPAAYKFYQKEYKDYFSEGPNDGPGDIWLTGDEYSCPIPEEWK